jgi:hypothetical protein
MTLSDLSPTEVQKLTNAIQSVAEVHSKRMSDAAIRVWCKALAPYAKGQQLYRALEAACEEERMPSLHRLRELMRGRPETNAAPTIRPLTELERKESDKAAILSLLWLHYAKGWELERVGAETIGRLVAARLEGEHDIAKVLAMAKEIYPRDLVLRWMDDQQRRGS